MFNIKFNFFSLIRVRIIYTSPTAEILGPLPMPIITQCLLDHKFWFLSTSSFLVLKFHRVSSSAHCPNLLDPEPCCCTFFFFSEPPTTVGLLFLPFLPAPIQEATRDAECEDADQTKCRCFLPVCCGVKPLIYHFTHFIAV